MKFIRKIIIIKLDLLEKINTFSSKSNFIIAQSPNSIFYGIGLSVYIVAS